MFNTAHSCQKNKEHKTQCFDYFIVVQLLCSTLETPWTVVCPWDSQVTIVEWVAISFSRVSPQAKDWTCVTSIGKQILYLERIGLLGHHNKYHWLGGLNNGNVLPHSSGGTKSEIKVLEGRLLLRPLPVTCGWMPSACVFPWSSLCAPLS